MKNCKKTVVTCQRMVDRDVFLATVATRPPQWSSHWNWKPMGVFAMEKEEAAHVTERRTRTRTTNSCRGWADGSAETSAFQEGHAELDLEVDVRRSLPFAMQRGQLSNMSNWLGFRSTQTFDQFAPESMSDEPCPNILPGGRQSNILITSSVTV